MQPVIDEHCLIPKEVRVVQKLYGYSAMAANRDLTIGYSELIAGAFYNMDDESRSKLGSTFEDADESIEEYLQFKELAANPNQQKDSSGKIPTMVKGKDHAFDVLLAIVELYGMKVEASHLERVMMCWKLGGEQLPLCTQRYAKL